MYSEGYFSGIIAECDSVIQINEDKISRYKNAIYQLNNLDGEIMRIRAALTTSSTDLSGNFEIGGVNVGQSKINSCLSSISSVETAKSSAITAINGKITKCNEKISTAKSDKQIYIARRDTWRMEQARAVESSTSSSSNKSSTSSNSDFHNIGLRNNWLK